MKRRSYNKDSRTPSENEQVHTSHKKFKPREREQDRRPTTAELLSSIDPEDDLGELQGL